MAAYGILNEKVLTSNTTVTVNVALAGRIWPPTLVAMASAISSPTWTPLRISTTVTAVEPATADIVAALPPNANGSARRPIAMSNRAPS